MIALHTGVSGLAAHEQAVDVIANNIANINTVGYKASRVTFAEALSQTIQGGSTDGTNPMQIGLGVALDGIDPNMTQGSLQVTGRPSDLAIEGSGLFVLGSGTETCYTRAGNFSVDGNNRLVAGNGMCVLGWQADPATGAVDSSGAIQASSYIDIPLGAMALSRATANVNYQSNLDATTLAGDAVDTSFYIYDSLGTSHQVQLTLTKTGDNTWQWEATSPDADPAVAPSTGALSFDSNGQCTTPAGSVSLTLASADGATNPVAFDIDFSNVTQLAGESTIAASSQDGLPIGVLESFTIDQNGMIIGGFSNGMTQTLGQIAMATFSNPTGLLRAGGNTYVTSPNSGVAKITTAGTSGCGRVAGGYLELSNVNLAEEFANLIVTQRGFQANSRIITTADEMMQELMALKR